MSRWDDGVRLTIGKEYGWLTCLEEVSPHRYKFRCRCGVEKEYPLGRIIGADQFKSCGCRSLVGYAISMEKARRSLKPRWRPSLELQPWEKNPQLLPKKPPQAKLGDKP